MRLGGGSHATAMDVQDSLFIKVPFLKKLLIRFGMSLVQYGSKNAVQFGYYINFFFLLLLNEAD